MSIKERVLSEQQKQYEQALRKALWDTRGNVRLTSRKLGVSREWVRRWVKRLNIDLDEYQYAKSYTVILDGYAVFAVAARDKKSATKKAAKRLGLKAADLSRMHVQEGERGTRM